VPRLVRGGKLAYGWSRVGIAGQIVVPPEALEEYLFDESQALFLLPGSRTSGGFCLGSYAATESSPLRNKVSSLSEHDRSRPPEGEVSTLEGKPHCWVKLHNGEIRLPSTTLVRYGIRVGDKLLVIRGSRLALAFAVRGPIVDEALKHPELVTYVPQLPGPAHV
jgi:bifunctional DNA-binding transcriptional regulator/antitoxin component of YhaV-PrlF toxin-antitoxin module